MFNQSECFWRAFCLSDNFDVQTCCPYMESRKLWEWWTWSGFLMFWREQNVYDFLSVNNAKLSKSSRKTEYNNKTNKRQTQPNRLTSPSYTDLSQNTQQPHSNALEITHNTVILQRWVLYRICTVFSSKLKSNYNISNG